MAKFRRIPKLSKKEQNEILTEFCEALASLKKPQEAAYFLKDLLGDQEAEMLAKRLKIAKLLLEEWHYETIQESLKVSPGTVARVNAWLNYAGGQGYRLVLKRTKNIKKKKGSWIKWVSKRRSPYLLLDHIIEATEGILVEKKARQLEEIFENIRSKRKVMRELNRLISEPYKEKAKQEKLRKLKEKSFKEKK